MNTMLTVVMLIMSANGNITKQTTETKVSSPSKCIAVQDVIIQRKMPGNVKLISVICSTTGKI